MIRYAELEADHSIRYIGEAADLPVMNGVTVIDVTGIPCEKGWTWDPLTGNLTPPAPLREEIPADSYETLKSFRMTMVSNCVLAGFPVPALPAGWTLTFSGGRALIEGRELTVPAASVVFTQMVDHVVYVNAAGRIAIRPLSSKPLPSSGELVLFQVYISTGINPSAPYAITDRRTFVDNGVRASLPLLEMIRAARITTGTYSGAFRMNRVGDINWYFANLGLYPFVEDLPTEVQAHLDRQITLFYGGSGTGSTDWATLHGTTWGAQYRWPYDLVSTGKTDATDFYSGTITKKRADSHDSYAATFLRLAVRFAKVASGGLAWWDANYTAIKDCLYYNVLVPQAPVPNGGAPAGYLTQTFQDAAVYPFALAMDNIEVYAAVRDTLALMATRGGTQATDAAAYAGYETNLLSGLRYLWTTGAPNANGETDWLALGWDLNTHLPLLNQHRFWYPDLCVYPMLELYDVTLHADPDIDRQRRTKALEWISSKAPAWWLSRGFDALPWAQNLVGMAKAGALDVALDGHAFIQRHHGKTFDGLVIHEMGWLRWVQRLLAGQTL